MVVVCACVYLAKYRSVCTFSALLANTVYTRCYTMYTMYIGHCVHCVQYAHTAPYTAREYLSPLCS